MKSVILLCLAFVAASMVSANVEYTRVVAESVVEIHEKDEDMQALMNNRAPEAGNAHDMPVSEKKNVHVRSVGKLHRSRRQAQYMELFKPKDYTHGCNNLSLTITHGCHPDLPTADKCCPMYFPSWSIQMKVCDGSSPYWPTCRKVEGNNTPGTQVGDCYNFYDKIVTVEVYCYVNNQFHFYSMGIRNYISCACLKEN